MKDNLSMIITMILLVTLIIIFPLYNYFEKQDDMSYNLVLKATTNFVDEVLNCGYLDQDMYDKFSKQLANTGNLYDIELEAHKKVLVESTEDKNKGNYTEKYLIDYNKDIFNKSTGEAIGSIDKKVLKQKAYILNVGDGFYVKLKNTNVTMAGAIFNTIVPTSKKERIAVNYGGIIKNSAWAKVDSSYLGYTAGINNPIIKVSSPNMEYSLVNPNSQVNLKGTVKSSDWWDNVVYHWSVSYSYKGTNYTREFVDATGTKRESNYKFTAEEIGNYTVALYVVNGMGEMTDTATTNITINAFDINTRTNNGSWGSTSGDGRYRYNQKIRIRAIPNVGCHLERWKEDGNNTSNRQITVAGHATYTANFAKTPYSVNIIVNDSSMGYTTGSGIYYYGDTVTINAIPYSGYEFVRWSDYGTTPRRQLTIQSPVTLVATLKTSYITCPRCYGAGNITTTCSRCQGRGYYTERKDNGPCEVCNGTGKKPYICPTCYGDGCSDCRGIKFTDCNDREYTYTRVTCSTTQTYTCPRCYGAGKILVK